LNFLYPTFVRTVVASKSPLTGLFCDSYAGGSFAIELRRAGYIGIVIEGKSDKLKCLEIERDEKSSSSVSLLEVRLLTRLEKYFETTPCLDNRPRRRKPR